VTGFVIDASRKIESTAIGLSFAASARPNAAIKNAVGVCNHRDHQDLGRLDCVPQVGVDLGAAREPVLRHALEWHERGEREHQHEA
jgi:hypothetical protein